MTLSRSLARSLAHLHRISTATITCADENADRIAAQPEISVAPFLYASAHDRKVTKTHLLTCNN
jgi:hypothetical protein